MDKLLRAIVLTIIALSTMCIVPVLGCQIIKFFQGNMLAMHASLLFFILFGVSLAEEDFSDGQLTFNDLVTTLKAYLVVLLFSRCEAPMALLSAVLFGLAHVYEPGREYLVVLAVLILLLGAGQHLRRQMRDHSTDFSLYKYIIGTSTCT